jgi:hypothetical protein
MWLIFLGGAIVADLNGIIPSLPSGGTYSQRQQYGPNGSQNPNYFLAEFDQARADALNLDNAAAGNGFSAYKPGGYIYGYADPTTGTAQTNFSNKLTDFVAGGKIIPSQYTQTVGQSVGPAQFQIGNQVTTRGVSSAQSSSPFTASSTTAAGQTPGPSANNPFLFGFNGDAGVLNGTFGNTTPGQATPFYQSGPMMTPQQQALIQSR